MPEKRWRRLATLGVALFALGCGNDGADPGGSGGGGPPGGSGSGGATAATGGSGASGGSANGGGANGGSQNASGGSATGGSSSDSGGSAGMGGVPGGSYPAERDSVCALDAAIGLVELTDIDGQMYVQAWVYDTTNPWIGEPVLTTPTCAYHRYEGGCSVECEIGETCSIDGECVAERRTIKDATLTVNADGEEREYSADPDIGAISSQIDIGTPGSAFAMALRWGNYEVMLSPMPVASGELSNLQITTEGDYSAPGALAATWEPSAEGAFVRTTIPINHHAGGPTFTECVAPDGSGAFHADAAMIDPLAVVTGLEFQGIDHVHIAAAETPAGCVEFRFGPRLLVLPE